MWQKVDSIQQPVITSSVVGPRSSIALPKAKLAPKKVMITVWWSAADLIHYICLNYHITSKKYDQKIDNKICNTCSRHWSTEWAQFLFLFFPWQCLTAHHITSASKVEQIGLLNFTSSAISTWLLAKQLPLLQASWKLFARKLLPQPAGGRKCFLRVHGILKHRFLCYRNKQTFLVSKNVLIVMILILINKDVLEPSYDDFKFTV